MKLIDSILSLSEDIRYVAYYQNGQLVSRARQGLDNASTGESDKYEELFVNPAILTLVHQRGEIGCGGVRYVLIRYGNFFQWIRRIRDGHLSVCIQPAADLFKIVDAIEKIAGNE